MKGLDLGGVKFSVMIDTDMLYVDKTLLVDDILCRNPCGAVFLYTRPRRFGKSNNLSMLEEFFDIRSKGTHRFDGLEISKPEYAKYDVHKNAYNVIHIDFKECDAETYDSFIHKMRGLISGAFKKQKSAIDWNEIDPEDAELFKQFRRKQSLEEDLCSSLRFLCEILYESNGLRTVILIDEYDTPVSHETDRDTQKKILNFLSGFLSSSLKGNEYIQLGFVTGILQIAKESMFSKLNNVTVNNIFSTTSDERYGFTESEVKDFLEDQECPDQFDTIKEWYDGYRFGNADVYNPKSIVYFSYNDRTIGNYWTEGDSGVAVRTLFNGLSIESFETLDAVVKGETIEHELDAGINLNQLEKGSLTTVLSVLAMSGYLKAVPTETPKVYRLSLANLEVRDSIRRMLDESTVLPTDMVAGIRKALLNIDAEALRKELGKILSCESYFDLLDERDYQQILLTILFFVAGDYNVVSQRESGAGRSDIVMISDQRPSIIFELKHSRKEEDLDRDAEAALKQIHDKRYYAGLKGDVILYGISFWSKFPCVKSEIITMERD